VYIIVVGAGKVGHGLGVELVTGELHEVVLVEREPGGEEPGPLHRVPDHGRGEAPHRVEAEQQAGPVLGGAGPHPGEGGAVGEHDGGLGLRERGGGGERPQAAGAELVGALGPVDGGVPPSGDAVELVDLDPRDPRRRPRHGCTVRAAGASTMAGLSTTDGRVPPHRQWGGRRRSNRPGTSQAQRTVGTRHVWRAAPSGLTEGASATRRESLRSREQTGRPSAAAPLGSSHDHARRRRVPQPSHRSPR